MGVNVANGGIGMHVSGGTRGAHMWAGIKQASGDQHDDYPLASITRAKKLCEEAAVSAAAFRAELNAGEKTWFDALPSAYQDAIITDAAAWDDDGYTW